MRPKACVRRWVIHERNTRQPRRHPDTLHQHDEVALHQHDEVTVHGKVASHQHDEVALHPVVISSRSLNQFKVSAIEKVQQGNRTHCLSDSMVSEIFSIDTIKLLKEF
jgi:hypothetical protein